MIRFFISRPVGTLALCVIVLMLGLISLARLQVDLIPNISFPSLTIVTTYENASPEQVEKLVSRRLEETISTVTGLSDVESKSYQGMSVITARFRWGTDMDQAIIEAREKVDLIKNLLPEDVERSSILRYDPNAEPILEIAVIPSGLPIRNVRDFVDRNIIPSIEKVDGVAAVNLGGGFERQILVELDRGRLEAFSIPGQQIVRSIQEANVSYPAGSIIVGDGEISIRTSGEYQSVDNIGNTSIGLTEGGVPIKLSQVATIRDSYRERTSLSRLDGTECVSLAIRKEPGKNTITVSQDVQEKLEILQSRFGKDLSFHIVIDRSLEISDAMGNVATTGILAIGICYLVLSFFLGDFREPLIVGISIPLSVLITFVVLFFAEVTLNTMSLGGLAVGVGMMVDSGTIVLESINRLKKEGLNAVEAAYRGTTDVAASVLGGTLTSCAVFIPVLFLEGVAGALFSEFALSISVALIASAIISLLVLPVLSAQPFFRPPEERKSNTGSRYFQFRNQFLERLHQRSGRLLTWSRNNGKSFRMTLLIIMILSLLAAILIPARIMPPARSRYLQMDVELGPGTALGRTQLVSAEMERKLLELDGVQFIFSRLGYEKEALARDPGARRGVHQGLINLSFDSESDAKDAREDIEEILDAKQFKGFQLRPGADNVARILGVDKSDYSVIVAGNDLKELQESTFQLAQKLEEAGLLTEVRTTLDSRYPEYQIEVDRPRMSRMGLSLAEVARQVQLSIGGREAGHFREGDREIEIFVRYRALDRDALSDVSQMPIMLSEKPVNLSSLADVRYAFSPEYILRQNGVRVARIFGDFGPEFDFGTLNQILEQRNSESEDLLFYEGPEREEASRSLMGLLFAGTAAILLVYMILAIQFENLILPFIVILTVAAAQTGVSLVLLLTGTSWSIVSGMGGVLLAGLVVNNGIILIDYFEKHRGSRSLEEVLRDGVSRRLEPIMNTVATTILGLLPAALSIPGPSPQQAMAISVIGGLLGATFLSLIVIPNAYSWLRKEGSLVRSDLNQVRSGEVGETPE